jgi:hypothetical protein
MQLFWEWRIEEADDVEELKEFGWWVKDGFFDNEKMLINALRTAEKSRGVLEGDHWIVKCLAKLTPEYPLLCARILNLMVRAKDTSGHFLFVYGSEVQQILSNIFRTKNKNAEKVGDQIIDHLTKLGFEKFRFVKQQLS